jgi:hypothetical protein
MYSTGYSCMILIKLKFSREFFENYSNDKFQDNPSSGSRVVACGRTDGQTDTTKLTVAVRNFVNAPKNGVYSGNVTARAVSRINEVDPRLFCA